MIEQARKNFEWELTNLFNEYTSNSLGSLYIDVLEKLIDSIEKNNKGADIHVKI